MSRLKRQVEEKMQCIEKKKPLHKHGQTWGTIVVPILKQREKIK
jgi:hypothetical protein